MLIDVTIQFCTCIFSLALIIAFRCRKEFQKTQSYVFFGILVILALNSLSSGISNLIENSIVATGAIFNIQYATQMILFLVHNALGPFYAYYVMLVNGKAIHTDSKKLFAYSLPFIASEILVAITPWTGAIFTYDANADYVRGPLFFLIYIISAFYLVFALTYMIKYRKLVTKETTFMLWLFFSFTIIGVVVQGIFPELKIELFAECLSSLGIMLSIEDERDLIDSSTRTYNRRAFMNDNKRLIETRHKYAVITISITNIRLFVHLLGYEAMSKTVAKIIKFLMSTNKHLLVYRVSTGNFAIIYMYDEDDEPLELVSYIKSRFEIGWEYDGAPLDLNVRISLALVPEYTVKPSALLELAENSDNSDISGITVATREEVLKIVDKGDIETAIRKALTNDGFEIYYQPIWNVAEKRYTAAEALIRMSSPATGVVSPAVFIPIAEKTGLIGDVGLVVFEKVCKFIASDTYKTLGLRYIDVNLSLYQLIVGNVPEQFKEIMKKYNVSPDSIILEITESAQIDGQGTITNAISELKEVGFKFSLDDFGTGYANMTDIVAMRFDYIKSDKGILWNAVTDRMASVVLCAYIKIIRGMGIDIVQEGVENEEQYNLVTNAGANFIQGYYFSKPLPETDFVEFIKKQQN